MRIAVAMLAYTLLGRYITLFLLARAGDDEPSASRSAEVKEIQRPDGKKIHVEFFGSKDGTHPIFTHGWSCNSTHWYYIKERFRKRISIDFMGCSRNRKIWKCP